MHPDTTRGHAGSRVPHAWLAHRWRLTRALFGTHAPDWPDDGRVGRFRLKRTAVFPASAPLVLGPGAGPGTVQQTIARVSRNGP